MMAHGGYILSRLLSQRQLQNESLVGLFFAFLSNISQVMVENSDFTPSQVGCLFTFLARQLAKPNNTLFVNRTLFDQASIPEGVTFQAGCTTAESMTSAVDWSRSGGTGAL